jgi:hypothetical protein
VKDEVSDDSNYEYLLNHTQKFFNIVFNSIIYFRQQLAHLVVQKLVNHKDKTRYTLAAK